MKNAIVFLILSTLFLAQSVTAQAQERWRRSMAVGAYPQRTAELIGGQGLLPGDQIRAITVCGDTVYFGTDKGIGMQINGEWRTLDANPQLPSGVTRIACTDAGIAIGADAGLYLFEKNKLMRIPGIDRPVTALAVNSHRLAVGTTSGLYLIDKNAASHVSALDKKLIRDVVFDADGTLWAGLEDGLSRVDAATGQITTYGIETDGSGLLHENVRSLYLDSAGMLWIGTPAGLSRFDRKNTWDHIKGKENGLPFEDILTISGRGAILTVTRPQDTLPFEMTGVNPGGEHQLWVGTSMGAALYDGREWHYFQGPQYLADDRVQALSVAPDGTAWLGTPAGATHVQYKMMTLEDKARFFDDYTQRRHNRYGLVSGCRLAIPGNPESCVPTTNDNDGLWTAMYVAAECYRYGATGDPQAKKLARQSLDSIMFLETVNETPGFVSRSFAKPDDPHCDGEWDHITSDGKWRWKGDTSSDEIDGHMYVYSVYYDVCADDSEKKEIRDKVSSIMGYIVDNDLYLIDVDGKPTSWGRWNPKVFVTDGFFLKGLNSLEILSYLQTAVHITGQDKFSSAYRNLVKEHGYAKNTVMQKLSHLQIWNHSDDELAFLAYEPLLKYETHPFLLEYYHRSLERSWQIERPEKNPLFNFIYANEFPGNFDLEQSIWMLQRIPLTGVRWPHRNSQRADVEIDMTTGRFSELQSVSMLPFDERTLHLWNENPFRLDSGSVAGWEQPGTFFLLPYWMGRYYGYIVEAE